MTLLVSCPEEKVYVCGSGKQYDLFFLLSNLQCPARSTLLIYDGAHGAGANGG